MRYTVRYRMNGRGQVVADARVGGFRGVGAFDGADEILNTIGRDGKGFKKFKNVAKKVAKSKAFKAVSNAAMKYADGASGGMASKALNLAKRVSKAASQAAESAEAEVDTMEPSEADAVREVLVRNRPAANDNGQSRSPARVVEDDDEPVYSDDEFEGDEEEYEE